MKVLATLPGLSLHPGTGTHWWRSMSFDDRIEAAQALDRLGFDYIMIPEHIVVDPATVCGSGAVLGALALRCRLRPGATRRIKVAASSSFPYHHPIELAKALATLDHLSGGRLVVVAMTGWSEWEFDTLGALVRRPRPETDEYVDAMVELWTRDVAIVPRHATSASTTSSSSPSRSSSTCRSGWAAARSGRCGGSRSGATAGSRTPPLARRCRRCSPTSAPSRGLARAMSRSRSRSRSTTAAAIRSPAPSSSRPRVVLDPDAVMEQAFEVARLGATVTDANAVLGTSVYQTDRPDAPPATKDLAGYLERLHWFAESALDGIHGLASAEPEGAWIRCERSPVAARFRVGCGRSGYQSPHAEGASPPRLVDHRRPLWGTAGGRCRGRPGDRCRADHDALAGALPRTCDRLGRRADAAIAPPAPAAPRGHSRRHLRPSDPGAPLSARTTRSRRAAPVDRREGVRRRPPPRAARIPWISVRPLHERVYPANGAGSPSVPTLRRAARHRARGAAHCPRVAAPPTVAPRALSWPVPTWVTSGYGLRGARFHGGVDLAARLGRPVAAPQSGGSSTPAGATAAGATP